MQPFLFFVFVSVFWGFEHYFRAALLSFHNYSCQSLFPAKPTLLLPSKLSKIPVLHVPRSAFDSRLGNWLDRMCEGASEFMLLRFLQRIFLFLRWWLLALSMHFQNVISVQLGCIFAGKSTRFSLRILQYTYWVNHRDHNNHNMEC